MVSERVTPLSPPNVPRPGLLLVVILVAIAVVYAPALDGPFLWDDRLLIVDYPDLATLEPIEFFTRPFFGAPGGASPGAPYYRPIVALSYALDFRLHGENPAGYHLTNILFHLAACALIFGLARAQCPSAGKPASGGAAAVGAASFVTLAWGLFPRLSECVAWISGRTDVMATVFSLAALYVWRPRASGRIAAAALVFAGLLCKEVAIATAAGIAVLEVQSAASGGTARSKYKLAVTLGPLGAVVSAYLVLRAFALAHVTAVPRLEGMATRLLTPVEAVGHYVMMLLDACRPRAQIGLVGERELLPLLIGAIVIVVTAGLAFRFRDKVRSPAFVYVACAVPALMLVLHVLPLPIDIVAADRYLYAPLAFGLLATVGSMQSRRLTGTRAFALCAIVITVFGAATYRRVLVWSDEVAFWATTLKTTRRDNMVPSSELGGVYYRARMFEQAHGLYVNALKNGHRDGRQSSRVAGLTGNVTACLVALGRYEEALQMRQEFAARDPERAQNIFDLGLAYLHVEQFRKARNEFESTLAKDPTHVRARALLETVDWAEKESTRLANAVDVNAKTDRARYLTRIGRPRDASRAWGDVVRSDEANPVALEEAAVFLVQYDTVNAAKAALVRLAETRAVSAEKINAIEHSIESQVDLRGRLAALKPP